MEQYLNSLSKVLNLGELREERTGTGTISLFGLPQMEFDLQRGFPLLTTKKMAWKSIVAELLWFISGSTNVRDLQQMGCHIWDANYAQYEKIRAEEGYDDEPGDLGPIYGRQWRSWKCNCNTYIDQLSSVIDMIRNNPNSRRLLVSAWNVSQLSDMALPPCHVLFQFYVRKDKFLDLHLYQRSGDMFLGVPFNIASYALLCMMVAQQTDLQPGKFFHTIGDAHIYVNHIEQARIQLDRTPRMLPMVEIEKHGSIDDYRPEHIHLLDYAPWPAIKGEMSV